MKNVDMDFWTLLFCFFINHWTHGACKRTLNQSVAVFDGRLKENALKHQIYPCTHLWDFCVFFRNEKQ